jgi:site-specific recombinase XerD
LQQSTTDALVSYATARDRLCREPLSRTFFISSRGSVLIPQAVGQTFHRLAVKTGLHTETKRPRVHDLRHSFATRALLSWCQSGIDVETQIVVLSTYLGHVNPSDSYWYLNASPELVELIAERLGDPPGDGEQ